jgi:hypothetical protein
MQLTPHSPCVERCSIRASEGADLRVAAIGARAGDYGRASNEDRVMLDLRWSARRVPRAGGPRWSRVVACHVLRPVLAREGGPR